MVRTSVQRRWSEPTATAATLPFSALTVVVVVAEAAFSAEMAGKRVGSARDESHARRCRRRWSW
jgi:hypothetical protein